MDTVANVFTTQWEAPDQLKQVLFMPRVTQHHRVWEGDVPGPEEHKKLYGFEAVHFLVPPRGHVTPSSWGS